MREEAFQRLSYKSEERLTKRLITQNRKEELKKEVLDKFGNISIGIHGKELPKYSDVKSKDNMKEWWKYQNGYVQSPRNFSNKLLRQNSKLGGKQDQ